MTRPAFLDNLKSQQAEIEKAIANGKYIVYGYLRSEDSDTAPAGTLYYVGLSITDFRPYVKHTRGDGGNRESDVPVPTDKRFVRLLDVLSTEEEMKASETSLIKRYGRKAFEDDGILLNMTLGGEGTKGFRHSDETKTEIARKSEQGKINAIKATKQKAADKYKVTLAFWESLSDNNKQLVCIRYANGMRGGQLFDFSEETARANTNKWRLEQACEKYEVTEEYWESLPRAQKQTVLARYKRGVRGKELFVNLELSGTNKRMQASAARVGVEFFLWVKFSYTTRNLIHKRFRAGKRGEELLAGIAA